MTKHASLPGFRDFFPEEMARRNQIFSAWRDVARRYGFEEYDGPPLESLGLYVEKSGPEIVNQLFNFVDKGGREVTLRPEMTPSMVRILGARIKGLPRPVRWFSTPQLFRYEKQQRGRLREHFQLNMDIVGEESVLADADLLAAALDVMRALGLTSEDVVARVSDRTLLRYALLDLGVSETDLPVAYNVIDKSEREQRPVLLERLSAIGLSVEKAEEALNLTNLDLAAFTTRFAANAGIATAAENVRAYFDALERLGFADWVTFDMKIVRGLAYYTGIVFELFDRKGELRAICGGGRYDNLFLSLTGTDVPALGFGLGDVVLGELLKERNLAAEASPKVDVMVVGVDDAGISAALPLVARLRREGHSVTFPYRRANVGKVLKAAANAGVKEVLLIGETEVTTGIVTVKNLVSGTERKVSFDDYCSESSAGKAARTAEDQ